MEADAKRFQESVIKEVMEQLRQTFQDNNISDDITEKLKQLWIENLAERSRPKLQNEQSHSTQGYHPSQYDPALMYGAPGHYPMQMSYYTQPPFPGYPQQHQRPYSGYPPQYQAPYRPPPIPGQSGFSGPAQMIAPHYQSAFQAPVLDISLFKRDSHFPPALGVKEESYDAQKRFKSGKNNDGNDGDDDDEEENEDEEEDDEDDDAKLFKAQSSSAPSVQKDQTKPVIVEQPQRQAHVVKKEADDIIVKSESEQDDPAQNEQQDQEMGEGSEESKKSIAGDDSDSITDPDSPPTHTYQISNIYISIFERIQRVILKTLQMLILPRYRGRSTSSDVT